MVMALFMIVMTMLAASIDAGSTSNIINNSFPDAPTGSLFNFLGIIGGYLEIFFKMLTFQLTGIPTIFNLLIFLPVSLGMLFIIVNIIRGTS
jgi:hypothetical protein